jgi:hypothetical protein
MCIKMTGIDLIEGRSNRQFPRGFCGLDTHQIAPQNAYGR